MRVNRDISPYSRTGLLVLLAPLLLAGCDPSLDSPDPRERARAVEKTTDQGVLGKMAIGNRNKDVGAAAVDRLTDQALLAKVAIEGKNWNVRTAEECLSLRQ